MSMRRGATAACLALGLALVCGTPAALHAARVGSFLYFWFDPQVIYNDGRSATKLQIVTDKKDVREVYIMGPSSTGWIELYDDGTHGDRTAGDGTFTVNNLTSDTLGLTSYALDFGGTHMEYGFDTRIVKGSGKVETSYEVGIGIVDKGQVFTATKLAADIWASEYAMFLVDPKGKALDSKIPLGSVKCGKTAYYAFQKLYSVSPDSFDFVFVMPAAQIFDPSRDYAENVPYEVPVKNAVQHIGQTIFDNTANFGSEGRLRGMVYHSFGYGAILDHEIGHGWSAWGFGQSLGITDGVHWEENTDIAGQMSLYVFAPGGVTGHLYSNGDGTWRIAREPGDDDRYSMLDLYLMGLVPQGKVPPVHKLINPDYSDPDRVTADSVETYTIKQLMQAAGGPRVPSSKDSPKKFNVALIAVKNKAFKPAEIAWFSLVAKYFSSEAKGDLSLTTFYTATGKRGTLDARLPLP
ncbi:MAG: choice-of-anchor X domain-containing protein [Acidobacteriota bacterium]